MTDKKYFLGRVCTILTMPINRDYQAENPASYPQPLLEYFTGIVEHMGDEYIIVRQLGSDLKCMFYTSKIVGICEERTLDPDVAEDKAEIEQLRPVVNKIQSGEKFDPKSLQELNRSLRK